MKQASWEDLKPKEKLKVPSEYAALCAAVFSNGAGRQLLDYLHTVYIDTVLPGIPDEGALLVHNSRRQLVRELELKVEEGLGLRAKEPTT